MTVEVIYQIKDTDESRSLTIEHPNAKLLSDPEFLKVLIAQKFKKDETDVTVIEVKKGK